VRFVLSTLPIHRPVMKAILPTAMSLASRADRLDDFRAASDENYIALILHSRVRLRRAPVLNFRRSQLISAEQAGVQGARPAASCAKAKQKDEGEDVSECAGE
jgi:hypothetical protein